MKSEPVILVADDDEDYIFLINYALKKAGIAANAQFVEDGQKIIDYLQGAQQFADRMAHPLPDLAVFDVKMPRMTGFEALEWLRKQPAFRDLPVMLLTSSEEFRDVQRAKDLGANSYVVKPPHPNDLSRALKEFCTHWWPPVPFKHAA